MFSCYCGSSNWTKQSENLNYRQMPHMEWCLQLCNMPPRKKLGAGLNIYIVFSSALHSVLLSDPSAFFCLGVVSEYYKAAACEAEPSVSHHGGATRHATAIRPMDFYCSLSQGEKPQPCRS